MPKGIIYVETMPASPDREAEYHKWYNDTHLEQILSVDGIVSARRFAPTNGNGPFIAIYELDCDDLDAAAQQMGGAGADRSRQHRHEPQAHSPRVPRDRITRTMTLPADVQRRIYALMVLMKAADDRLSKGIGTGEFMCVYWPSRGQEAVAAAMGVTLRRDDQLVTTYRGLHDLIGKGVPLEEIYGEMMGRTLGASRGKGGTMHIAKPEAGVMLSTGIVGAGPPVAVGLAMAAKRKGLDRVTVVSFGDGATNTGSFHEAANMAALWDLPVVFVCQNNQYAEMTPTVDTMKLENVADRAAGYGMPGIRVDGNDPLAVADALAAALARARGGDGPTFLECVTFRFRGHYFGDRMPYIPKDQLEAAMAADPVPRFRRQLIDTGVCTDDELSGIDEGALTEVEMALKAVMSADAPSVEELDRDVYATPISYPV